MILRLIGFLLLIFLPGAWITFGLPLKSLSYGARLLFAVVLTPLVVLVEFYILRGLGAPFGLTAVLLVVVNLPALYLLIREYRPIHLSDRRAIAVGGLVFLIIIATIAPFLLDPQKRVYTWEAWMHADIIYSLANGNLILQDPDLAGVILSYPWVGHIYQGVLSYLIGTSPVTNFIWLNLVWLLLMFGFAAGIVAQLGGGRLAQATVGVWLAFGVNPVGYVLQRAIPLSWSDRFNVLRSIAGDDRYSPWLEKVLIFHQMWLGMGLFIAIVFLILKPWPSDHKRYHLALAALLLVSLGLFYSILLPAAFVIVGAKMLLLCVDYRRNRNPGALREVSSWAAISVVSALVTFAQIKFLTQGRASAPLARFNDLHTMKYESIITVVALSLLLLGFVLTVVRCWQTNSKAVFILAMGAAASCMAYVLFDIPWWRNEYKFIFTAAICLAPFAALALERVLKRMGKLTLPAVALATLVLASPFIYKTYWQPYYWYTRPGPLADASHFELELDGQQPLAGLLNTIRQKTPTDSLLVLQNTAIHYPTLTSRQLYVAPADTKPQPGILVTNDEVLTLIKGYPQQLVDDRRSTVKALFDSADPAQMSKALDRILQFQRPLVLVLDERGQASLRGWLVSQGIGKPLTQADGLIVWLIDAKSDYNAAAHSQGQ
jgi:hypothetical protein